MESDVMSSLRLGPTVKGGKVRISNMEPLNLSRPTESLSPLIHEAVAKLTSPTGPQDQVAAIEKLLKCDLSEKADKRFIIQIFIECLVQLNPKAQLRNKILKGLPVIASMDWNSYEDLMIKELLQVLENPTAASGPTVIVLSCMVENPGHLLAKPTQPGHTCISENSGHENATNEETSDNFQQKLHFHNTICHAIVQSLEHLWNKKFINASSSVSANITLQLLQTLVKSACKYIKQVDQQTHNHLHHNLEDLYQKVFHVLSHGSCPLDLRINCGQLFVLLHSVINKRNISQLVVQILSREITYKESKLSTDFCLLSQLSILNGILCMHHGAELFSSKSEDGKHIAEAILNFGLRSSLQGNDGNVAVSVCRLVQTWVLRAKEHSIFLSKQNNALFENDLKMIQEVMNPSSTTIQQLLEYLWLTWEHYLDSVKHMVKDIFHNFMKTEMTLYNEESKSFFLQLCKNFLSPSCCHKWRYSAVSTIIQSIGAQSILVVYKELPTQLLLHMKDHSQASSASELLETLFTVHSKEVPIQIWQELWLAVFLDNFSPEMQAFGYDLLLKKLLVLSPNSLNVALTMLIESENLFKGNKLYLVILCAKIGRSHPKFNGKVSKSKPESVEQWKNILPYMTIEFCLSSCDESIQMAAFNLLCESSRSTELFENKELEILLDFFEYCLSSQNPTCRQQVISGTKKIFSRIYEGIAALSKIKKKKENESQSEITIGFHKEFCESFFSKMLLNLHCGANFMRRGQALQLLNLFHNIFLANGCFELNLAHVYQSIDVVDTLLYCLGDPYENNKLIALNLLLRFSDENASLMSNNKVKSLLDSALEMASSCRPPETLTASYLIKFLINQPKVFQYIVTKEQENISKRSCSYLMSRFIFDKLQAEVDTAKSNLFECASSGPMYGLLSCLRMIIFDVKDKEFIKDCETWKNFLCEVIDISFRISEIVAPVVRNDSPEGHLPMDLNPESLVQLKNVLQQSIGYHKADDDKLVLGKEADTEVLVKAHAVSAQMMLLCAWRSIKEISLLLGGLISTVPLPPHTHAILDHKVILDIGKYFLTQLIEIKHRGAFEQTYVGFGKMCDALWCCEDLELKKLPEIWLTEVLNAINTEDSGGMCATRRSAGVPFIIQAILSSEPQINGATCMNNTMKTLLKFASGQEYDGSVQRVHSFNILRALYKETRLGDQIIPFVAEGVKAAIQGFKSKSWAERNSATLLFAALITRMFGVKKTKDDLNKKNAMSATVFFKRYPELYDFLKEEVKNGSQIVQNGKLLPSLYPTLLLLARLAPAPIEGRNSAISMSSFTQYVLQCASSSILQLRVLASHALVPLVSHSQLSDVIIRMCKTASPQNQNQLHGLLLCLKKLVKTYKENIQASETLQRSLVNNISSLSWAATESNSCLITCNYAIQLFSELLQMGLISVNLPFVESITKNCLNLVTQECKQVHDGMRNLQLQHVPGSTLCQQSATKYLLLDCIHVDTDVIRRLIESPNYDIRLIALEKAMEDNVKFSYFTTVFLKRLYEEDHQECLILIHQILRKSILHRTLENTNLSVKSVEDCMIAIMLKLESESKLDVCSSMLDLASVCLKIIVRKNSNSLDLDTVSEWVKLLLIFSSREQPDNVRTVVVTALLEISPLIKSSLSENIKLQVLEMTLYMLQDDSYEIRQLAVKVAITLFPNLSIDENSPPHKILLETNKALEPLRAIDVVCKGIAEEKSPKYLSLLVKVTLLEEESESVGLGCDSERMFDKGEMNVYSEQVVVAHKATQALKQVLQSWSHENKPLFDRSMIYPHLLMTFDSETNEQATTYKKLNDTLRGTISLDEMLSLLKEDMDIVFSKISSITSQSLFSIHNLDLWILRLNCRSLLLTSLKCDGAELTEWLQAKREFLDASLLRPYFIRRIIEDFS